MIKNLIILFFGIVFCVGGLVYYHYIATKNINNLPLNLFHYEDKTTNEKLDFIIEKAKFIKTKNERQSFGFTSAIHWYKFHLEADQTPKSLSLEINNLNINKLELFEKSQNSIKSLGLTGDSFPFDQRPTPTKTFVYQISLNAYQSVDYYLMLDKRNEVFSTEINLWNTSDFENKDQRAYFLWGIFYGLSFLVVIVNSLFFYSTKDKVYLWFAIYILAMAIGQMAESGLSFQYIWPSFPVFNHPEPLIQSVWLYSVSIISFQQHFFQLKNQNILLFKYSQIIKYVYWLLLFGLIFLQIFNEKIVFIFTESNMRYTQIILLFFTFILFGNVVKIGFISKNKILKLYAIGFLIQFFFQILIAFQKVSSSKSNGFYFIDSFQLLMLVFLIDLIFFTYLLAVRYRNTIHENTTLQLVLAENSKQLGDNIINILAKERIEIYGTLKHEVESKLDFVLYHLEKNAEDELSKNTKSLIEKVKQNMHSISANIIPIDLLNIGLARKLAEIAENLNETQKIDFTFGQIGEKKRLPIEKEIQVFRIANELINNIIKHSEASKANIKLINRDPYFELSVEDNGIGFDIKNAFDGIGLKNIYARSAEIRAKVELKSDEKGTIFKIYSIN